MLKIYNTLSRKKEKFIPLHKGKIGMYSCGPTVYDYPHIGNMRTYITVDVIKRYLTYKGYEVRHIMNITDVGHLTSDEDEGEDKLEKGASREKKTVWEVAEFYTNAFKHDMALLNITEPTLWTKATDHIQDQIELITQLEEKGFAYETGEALYFDVSKFPKYTNLSRQDLTQKLVGVRKDVRVDTQKRNPQDFALWFKLVGKFKNHTMHWPSPWGQGFPGWHIECSAMSMKYLGETLDIHVGGIEHIGVHHTNEIAQSEAATGKPFVKYWMHADHLLVEGKKMAKSEGTFITLKDIQKRGINPLAFRLLCLQAHYRSKLNFTWDSLKAAQESLTRVEQTVKKLGKTSGERVQNETLIKALDDDVNMPKALSVFFDLLSQVNQGKIDDKLAHVLFSMDSVLGLGLGNVEPSKTITHKGATIVNDTGDALSSDTLDLIVRRRRARQQQDWGKADELRREISDTGYDVEDGEEDTIIKPRR